jgi:hypothetical protein
VILDVGPIESGALAADTARLEFAASDLGRLFVVTRGLCRAPVANEKYLPKTTFEAVRIQPPRDQVEVRGLDRIAHRVFQTEVDRLEFAHDAR